MPICNPPIIRLEETASTNSYLKNLKEEKELQEGTVVITSCQSGGRGQMGTSWESEPYKNLTFSIILYPEIIPANQSFIISQIASLAIQQVLSEETDNIFVKWPNDIYFLDRKICGILIENEISGTFISSSVIGIGLNVNQAVFTGNAPNPVSLTQITGKEYDLQEVLDRIVRTLLFLYEEAKNGKQAAIASLYKKHLYHGDSFYQYTDANGHFTATIEDVMPDGHLILRTTQGERRKYAFKEISQS